MPAGALRLALVAALLGAGVAGCDDGAGERVLAIAATGVVTGTLYFDANGNLQLDESDQRLDSARVFLFPRGTRDTLVRATTGGDGTYRLAEVPVGAYEIGLDPAVLGDTLGVIRIDPGVFTLGANDTIAVAIAVGYPAATVEDARELPAGTRVFVDGLALNARETFGDQTVHIAGDSAAIRTFVRPVSVVPGDSVRMRGVIGSVDGQPALLDAVAFVIARSDLPPARRVTTDAARHAEDGRLDAAQVEVVDATVESSVMAGGDLRVTVDDGSGPLLVVIDRDTGLPTTPYAEGTVMDVTGLLVPDGAGTWILKPRFARDLIVY